MSPMKRTFLVKVLFFIHPPFLKKNPMASARLRQFLVLRLAMANPSSAIKLSEKLH